MKKKYSDFFYKLFIIGLILYMVPPLFDYIKHKPWVSLGFIFLVSLGLFLGFMFVKLKTHKRRKIFFSILGISLLGFIIYVIIEVFLTFGWVDGIIVIFAFLFMVLFSIFIIGPIAGLVVAGKHSKDEIDKLD